MSNPNGRNFLGGGYDHFAHQTDSADLEASGFSAGENSYLHQLMADSDLFAILTEESQRLGEWGISGQAHGAYLQVPESNMVGNASGAQSNMIGQHIDHFGAAQIADEIAASIPQGSATAIDTSSNVSAPTANTAAPAFTSSEMRPPATVGSSTTEAPDAAQIANQGLKHGKISTNTTEATMTALPTVKVATTTSQRKVISAKAVDESVYAPSTSAEEKQPERSDTRTGVNVPAARSGYVVPQSYTLNRLCDMPDPFCCPICFHAYRSSGSVREHLKRVHSYTIDQINQNPDARAPKTLGHFQRLGMDNSYRGSEPKQVNARRRWDAGMTANSEAYWKDVYKSGGSSKSSD